MNGIADHGGLRKHGIYFLEITIGFKARRGAVEQNVGLVRQRHDLECLKYLAKMFRLSPKLKGGPLEDFK